MSLKKILLIGFIVFLLIAIPVTIYLVSQQLKSNATPVPETTLSFTPYTQSASIGQDLNFDVNVSPQTNSVSYVELTVLYDPTKLATEGAGFTPNKSAFPLIVSGPDFSPGTITVTVSVNQNSTPVNKPTQVGVLTFKTLDTTEGSAPTQVTFGNQTQVLANGPSTTQGAGNLLATTVPANININSGQESLTPTPIAEALSPTQIPGALSPTPTTTELAQALETPTPTIEDTPTQAPADVTVTPTQASSFETTTSTGDPTCLSFTADRETTGTAPFNVNFTLVGTSSADIQKATFDFGDGQTQDITADSGAISGNTVNVLTMHVYTQTGSFTASGSITDVDGNVSAANDCTLQTVVNSASGSAETTPVPSLAPSGPAGLVTLGAVGLILAVIGVFLIIAL